MLSFSALPTFTPPPPPSKKPLPNTHLFTHPSTLLLELCSHPEELPQLLPPLIKHDIFNQYIVQTKLISLFSRFGHLPQASLVFSSITPADRFPELYSYLLKGHCHHSPLPVSLLFFISMKHSLPHFRLSVHNFTYLLKACADSSDLTRGREIHAQLVSHGFSSNVFAMTAVLNLYAKCRQIDEARKMFDRMPERDLVAWNALVSGYAQNGMPIDCLELVRVMQAEDDTKPDSITLVSALPACTDMQELRLGMSVHAFAVRAGFERLVNICTTLVDMYAKCGRIKLARRVFDGLQAKNVVSWNSMIDGYTHSGDAEEAIRLYRLMLALGAQPTEVTVLAALNACSELSNLEEGQRVHELAIRISLRSNVSVMNALITMYSKCKRPDLAAQVFESLHTPTLVSYNSMILGYAQNDRPEDALRLFAAMQLTSLRPDSFTLVSAIPAVADVSVLRRAKWMHGHAVRLCLDHNVFVATALVDMYAKCGGVALARRLFDSMTERHVTTWNAMIDGYGTHGFGRDAVQLFDEMYKSPVAPNDVTFLCVLSACSHAGLVNEGKRLFESMTADYRLTPSMDHYGAMVDLLGRAGLLDEAWQFIQEMPIEPGISIYGAMLGACKIHKNVELGEAAAEQLFKLKPSEGGYHVLLANIYASASMWDKVARVRRLMEEKGLQKTPGHSSFEVNNKVHVFYSGSTGHPQSRRIYVRLRKLMEEIAAEGYVPDGESVHDVEDDVHVQLLATHSEKLAIAFGLISTSEGTTIQIKKNLRVCRDCHTATKYISKVTGREIIVRDMQRFHHFKDGKCSCGDYW